MQSKMTNQDKYDKWLEDFEEQNKNLARSLDTIVSDHVRDINLQDGNYLTILDDSEIVTYDNVHCFSRESVNAWDKSDIAKVKAMNNPYTMQDPHTKNYVTPQFYQATFYAKFKQKQATDLVNFITSKGNDLTKDQLEEFTGNQVKESNQFKLNLVNQSVEDLLKYANETPKNKDLDLLYNKLAKKKVLPETNDPQQRIQALENFKQKLEGPNAQSECEKLYDAIRQVFFEEMHKQMISNLKGHQNNNINTSDFVSYIFRNIDFDIEFHSNKNKTLDFDDLDNRNIIDPDNDADLDAAFLGGAELLAQNYKYQIANNPNSFYATLTFKDIQNSQQRELDYYNSTKADKQIIDIDKVQQKNMELDNMNDEQYYTTPYSMVPTK